MPQFRLGDQGSAVAEIRSILAGQGLLSTTHGRHAAEADTPGDTFDADTDQAVRAFQQQRGLIVDGIVGPATYRALREASYQLGARVLAFRFSAPMVGERDTNEKRVGSCSGRRRRRGPKWRVAVVIGAPRWCG